VISPEGNGIDCHRHYEALIAGCIPIIEDNSQIREKYKGCPILYTHDYSEITETYLIQKYTEMLDQTYDFAPLFLSTYTPEEQEEIKKCGNYWTQVTTNRDFYPPTQPSKTVPTTVPQAPISKPRPQAPSVYSYATSISYNVPNGGQTMDVNISLQNKVVVSVSISQSKRGGTSAEYQQNFQNSYKSYVVGKNINDISLSRVGGASLTTNAFNKAINSIKSNL